MLDRTSVTKSIRLVGKTFLIEGVAPDDPYFNSVVVDGYDPDFERICRMFIGPRDTCLDIGANIGMTALTMSRFAKRVIAIEGGKSAAAVLARNCRSEANIETEHCAVTDYDGEVNFLDVSAWGRIASEWSRTSGNNTVTVPAKRLTTILAERGIERLDFLKIDVEGSEFTILKDALDAINAHHTLVYFEFNTLAQLTERTSNPWDFAQWITANFNYIYLTRRGGHPLQRVTSDIVGAHEILEVNVVKDTSVTDIVATNAPERLVGRLAEIEFQTARTHQVEKEIAAMRATISWRVTAPLRSLRRRIG